jgi:hypothetical protein
MRASACAEGKNNSTTEVGWQSMLLLHLDCKQDEPE